MLASPVRAAQYLRMSTDHQRFSLENQVASIATYAADRGLEIVRSYVDAGKSGLGVKERAGLKSLLADVLAGSADYQSILVLDVSRWGRFQDPDQAAHYEFLCREAGVSIHYCGETFENDGSLTSSLLKNLKRIMAGEYSAELSRKTLAAQKRQAARGFKQGGSAPFGFRRLVIDFYGTPKFILGPGEYKAQQSDRVIFVPGQPHELRVLRTIYKRYAAGVIPPQIAKDLTSAGALNVSGRAWSGGQVLAALRNELVAGIYVYNKTTARLYSPQIANPEHLWVRARVFKPIVAPALLAAVAARLRARGGQRMPDALIWSGLRRLLDESGTVSLRNIAACEYLPGPATIRRRFGDLSAVCAKLGYNRRRYRRARDAPYTREFLSACLAALLAKHGRLSLRIIEDDLDTPSPDSFYDHFRSLTRAYASVGYIRTHSEACLDGLRAARARRRGSTSEVEPLGELCLADA